MLLRSLILFCEYPTIVKMTIKLVRSLWMSSKVGVTTSTMRLLPMLSRIPAFSVLAIGTAKTVGKFEEGEGYGTIGSLFNVKQKPRLENRK